MRQTRPRHLRSDKFCLRRRMHETLWSRQIRHHPDFRPEMVHFGPDKADLGPQWADFGLERANFRPERADFGPERAEFWA